MVILYFDTFDNDEMIVETNTYFPELNFVCSDFICVN